MACTNGLFTSTIAAGIQVLLLLSSIKVRVMVRVIVLRFRVRIRVSVILRRFLPSPEPSDAHIA